jgi:xylose isomerase
MMVEVLRAGGFKTGGMNFDAKIRRQSIEPDDLLHAHVGSMDATAKALLNAEAIMKEGSLQKFVDDRYTGWGKPFGKDILAGKTSLDDLAKHVAEKKLDPQPKSGRQEYLEGLLNRFG